MALLFLGGKPTWALTGIVQERIALCRTPKQECVPLFFLQKDEQVEVLGQTLKGDWLEVQFGKPPRTGWLKRDSLQFRQLKSLIPHQRLQQDGFQQAHLWYQNKQLWLMEPAKSQLWQIPDKGKALLKHHFERPDPEVEAVFSGGQDNQNAWAFERISTEGQVFLQQIKQTLQHDPPAYVTWLRLGQTSWPIFVYPQTDSLWILGRGVAPWGQNLLSASDWQGHLRWLISDHEQIQAFLPLELRAQLADKALFLLALDQQGYLYVKAIERLSRHLLILKLKPSENAQWQHVGTLNWPVGLAAPSEKIWPSLWVSGNASETYLSFLSETKPSERHLYYYSVANEPVYHAIVPELHALTIGAMGELWTLEGDRLMRRIPKFSESKL